MKPIDEIAIDVAAARVYEEGWQSWSPSTTYSLSQRPHRPVNDHHRIICYRPDTHFAANAFCGEGLLAIDPGNGSGLRIYAAHDGTNGIPTIVAERNDNTLTVSASGPVDVLIDKGQGALENALARWADGFASRAGVGTVRKSPSIWCSWYQYFTSVTEDDMVENIDAIDRLELPIDVIQLDDGYQTAHGDWLTLSDRFESLQGIADRIANTGRRSGIWLAPFLVFPDSDLAANHPDWLVGGATSPVHVGQNWGRDLYALDTTHPGAMEWISEVFRTMHGWGFDFFKIDFIYAAAVTGARYEDVSPMSAYRSGLRAIRNAIGDSYLLGCGAPTLGSVGLVDAMRVSPDTGFEDIPIDGDYSQPSIESAIVTGRGRAYQQGRFWVNDPDNLMARPAIRERQKWANHIKNFGGLRGSSDRIEDLDHWGFAVTRELLADSQTEPFIPSRGHA